MGADVAATLHVLEVDMPSESQSLTSREAERHDTRADFGHQPKRIVCAGDVTCPFCGATPGDLCRTKSGKLLPLTGVEFYRGHRLHEKRHELAERLCFAD